MDEPVKAKKGKANKTSFKPGNKFNPTDYYTKKPDEHITINDKDEYKDSKGRWLPGCSPAVKRQSPKMAELKKAAVEAQSVEDYIAIIEEVKYIIFNREYGPKIQLQAAKFWRDSMIGLPTQELLIEKHSTSVKTTIDYSKYSEQELRDLERLTQKATIVDAVAIEYKPKEG